MNSKQRILLLLVAFAVFVFIFIGHRFHVSKMETIDPPNESHESQLHPRDIESVETFLIFIGWQRSCHSIIGSMLDAHPNMIIAHEYFLFVKLAEDEELSDDLDRLYTELYSNSYKNVKHGWRSDKQTRKGYNFKMNGSWQGKFDCLKVIGDKSGGRTTMEYHKNSKRFKSLYHRLESTVQVPIKTIQIVRNPLDMIATETLYRGSPVGGEKVKVPDGQKYSNFTKLGTATRTIVGHSKTLMKMIPDLGLSPLEVHCEDLINGPVMTISRICEYLNLECSQDYLQMCADKTYKNVSESRYLVQWNPVTLPSLTENLSSFPFFHRYIPSFKELLLAVNNN